MAFVKLYGKVLGIILLGIWTIILGVGTAQLNASIKAFDDWKKCTEERLTNLEMTGLKREDIRAELNAFKLDLIESGMLIVPSRNRNTDGRK